MNEMQKTKTHRRDNKIINGDRKILIGRTLSLSSIPLDLYCGPDNS